MDTRLNSRLHFHRAFYDGERGADRSVLIHVAHFDIRHRRKSSPFLNDIAK